MHRRQSVGLGAVPVKHGSACVPMPGYDIDVVDEANHKVPAGKIGSIVIKLPMPPGSSALWQQDTRLRRKPISTNSPATTRPPTPATKTRTATST